MHVFDARTVPGFVIRPVEQAAALTPEYRRLADEVGALAKSHQEFVDVGKEAVSLAVSSKSSELEHLASQIETEAASVDTQAAKVVAEIERFTEESTQSANDYESAAKRVSTMLSVRSQRSA